MIQNSKNMLQVVNSLTYHRQKNVLSSLTANNAKVKGIMKVNKPHMDDNGSPYLFGGKFEEKLTKVTNKKQKSKLLFPGLQSKPAANDQQPFWASSLHQNPSMRRGHGFFLGRVFSRGKTTLSKTTFSAESGNSKSRYLHACACSNKKSDFSNKSAQNPNKRAASVFSWELVKDNKRTVILDIVKGYQTPFVDLKPCQVSALASLKMSQEEVLLENEELQELLGEGTIKLSEPSSYQFLSSIFLISKENRGQHQL